MALPRSSTLLIAMAVLCLSLSAQVQRCTAARPLSDDPISNPIEPASGPTCSPNDDLGLDTLCCSSKVAHCGLVDSGNFCCGEVCCDWTQTCCNGMCCARGKSLAFGYND